MAKRLQPKITPHSHISLAMNIARENENLSLKPYHDTVSKLTIGYGRNIEDNGIRYAEAEAMLINDILEAHSSLHSQFSFYKTISDLRQAVFIDLYHNMGIPRLLTFKKMLRAMQISDYDEAAIQLKDSKYWEQTGRRAMRNYCILRFNRYFTREEAVSYFKNQ